MRSDLKVRRTTTREQYRIAEARRGERIARENFEATAAIV
jgi:hypothetical protein